MKQFFFAVALLFAAVFWWRDFVASGRFVKALDNHPHRKGTASALFYLAQYYELFNSPEKAVPLYRRVAERYPKSRYGEDAQFGLATCYEAAKDWNNAKAEYDKFLELYPNSRYGTSVRNNVEILKTR